MPKKRTAAEQRKYDDFCAGVERATRALLEAADQLQDAMEAVSRRRIPCKIAAAVGRRAWRSFATLDARVLAALERANDLGALLAPERKLDACGQAPCPRCRAVKTTDGVPCSDCEVLDRRGAPG
jgi:hypothetical protein